MAFLEWLQGTWVGLLVAESLWGYPLLETIHTIGMAMLIGSLGLINLRVLGYKPELPLIGTRELLPLAWIGFTLNAISGSLLFTSDAVYFFSSYTFRIKMVLIVLGGGRLPAGACGDRDEMDRGDLASILARRGLRRPTHCLPAVTPVIDRARSIR
jgi:hypothetical protein